MRTGEGDTYTIPQGRSRTSVVGFKQVLTKSATAHASSHNVRSRGTALPYHNTIFYIAPTRLSSLIFPL